MGWRKRIKIESYQMKEKMMRAPMTGGKRKSDKGRKYTEDGEGCL